MHKFQQCLPSYRWSRPEGGSVLLAGQAIGALLKLHALDLRHEVIIGKSLHPLLAHVTQPLVPQLIGIYFPKYRDSIHDILVLQHDVDLLPKLMSFVLFIEVVIQLMSIKHRMYVVVFKCITSQVGASILFGITSLNDTGSQRALFSSNASPPRSVHQSCLVFHPRTAPTTRDL